MNEDDLDRCYTALCESLAAVDEDKAQLFLAMMSLALLARYERGADVLQLIANVEAQCRADPERLPTLALRRRDGEAQQ